MMATEVECGLNGLVASSSLLLLATDARLCDRGYESEVAGARERNTKSLRSGVLVEREEDIADGRFTVSVGILRL